MSTKDIASSNEPKGHQPDRPSETEEQKTTTSGSENSPAEPSGSDAHRSSQSEAPGDQNTAAIPTDPSSAWTTAWDENSQAYYWWNMVTYETTWENPYEKSLPATATPPPPPTATTPIDPHRSTSPSPMTALAASPSATYSSSTPPPQDGYTFQAYFNTRTGKFQSASEVDRLNPERLSIENRAKRQMQYYFDVDAYMEQRNREIASGKANKKRPLTKKDIERFKRAKQEKKMRRAREWLCD